MVSQFNDRMLKALAIALGIHLVGFTALSILLSGSGANVGSKAQYRPLSVIISLPPKAVQISDKVAPTKEYQELADTKSSKQPAEEAPVKTKTANSAPMVTQPSSPTNPKQTHSKITLDSFRPYMQPLRDDPISGPTRIFDNHLRQQWHTAQPPVVPASVLGRTIETPYGEQVQIKDTCYRVSQSLEDSGAQTWNVGRRCKWIKTESEQFMDKVNEALANPQPH